MAKHGIENFEMEVLSSYNSLEECNEAEFQIIKNYKSKDKNFGYNIKPGGRKPGYKHSEKTKRMMSEKWHQDHPPESIEKTARANRGRKMSEEQKEKIRQANLGNEKIIKALTGKKQPKEVIEKRVKAIAEKYGSKVCNAPGCDRTDGSKVNGVRYCGKHEQRMRVYGSLELPERIAHNKGISPSEETKRKISESLKGNVPVNKKEWTPEQLKLILSDKPSRKIAKELGIGKTTVLRVRKRYKEIC